MTVQYEQDSWQQLKLYSSESVQFEVEYDSRFQKVTCLAIDYLWDASDPNTPGKLHLNPQNSAWPATLKLLDLRPWASVIWKFQWSPAMGPFDPEVAAVDNVASSSPRASLDPLALHAALRFPGIGELASS